MEVESDFFQQLVELTELTQRTSISGMSKEDASLLKEDIANALIHIQRRARISPFLAESLSLRLDRVRECVESYVKSNETEYLQNALFYVTLCMESEEPPSDEKMDE